MALDFGKLNFSVSFNPTSAFPLDSRSYFESYDAAVAAAATADVVGSSTTTYYYGETIAVVENDIATLYTIQPDKTLAEVGSKVEINTDVFAHDENGALNLYGFAEAVAGAQLLKGADGKLSWVKPDSSTIEGIQTIVAGIQEDIIDINTVIGNKEAGTGLAGDIANLETRVDGVYTKEEADTAIGEAIANADHLQRKIVATVEEIDVQAADADKFIYMVPKTAEDADQYDEYMVINGAVEKVGDWKVDLSEYAKTTDVETALAGKVDAVEGSRLITDTEATKLEGIADGAQVNVIDAVSGEFTISEDGKTLNVNVIDIAKITGLDTALAGKVDAVEGSRLITDTEVIKLEGIADGAQVNVIDTVDQAQFAVDENKNLTLLDIAMGKVTGLDTALAGKVDAVEGKGLSTHDLSDDLLSKLNAAQPNVIESITLNDVALEIQNKAVNIGIAGANLGVVKSSDVENKVHVDSATGEMEVNNINVNKIVQTEGDVLILNGGTSNK